MMCPIFKELRNEYLPTFYKNRPPVHKFNQLMQTTNKKLLTNLAKLVKDILLVFQ